MLFAATSAFYFLPLLLLAPYAFKILVVVVAIVYRLYIAAWSTLNHLLKNWAPTEPERWRYVAWLIGMYTVIAWASGLMFLGLLRQSQLGAHATELDRQQFCSTATVCWAFPYKAITTVFTYLWTLSPLRQLLWLLPMLLVACIAKPIYPACGVLLKRFLGGPYLVISYVLHNPPKAERCNAAVCAAAAPIALLLLSMSGWLALPLAAMWYLSFVSGLSLITLAVFADDKLIAEAIEEEESRQPSSQPSDTWAKSSFPRNGRGRRSRRPFRRRRKRSRVSEAALLILAILGGWPGALTGQQLLTHKVSQRAKTVWFATLLYGTIPLHAVAALGLLYLWA